MIIERFFLVKIVSDFDITEADSENMEVDNDMDKVEVLCQLGSRVMTLAEPITPCQPCQQLGLCQITISRLAIQESIKVQRRK